LVCRWKTRKILNKREKQMSSPEREKVRRHYRARVAAIQATFEGYVTAQRARLASLELALSPKKRAAMLKKLDKDEATMAKAFRRAIKELEK
jgi:hypothetical protein